MLRARIHHDVAGTVHRTQDVLLAFALHHRVHSVAEVVPVTGLNIELPLRYCRRHHVLVAALDLKILYPPLQLAADGSASREPEDVPRTHFINNIEEL